MNESVSAYLEFLWQQFQYDWSWMSNPWVFYTVIPVILYGVFFFFKWIILLAPITVPIMTWGWCAKTNAIIKSKRRETENHWENN
jgi:hypothetical protein